MQIDHLAEFVDLARSLSYSETAERFHIAESSLSRHVRALEADLEVQLFERTARRVRITPVGEAVLPYARSVLGAWQECRREAQRAAQGEPPVVVLASSYYVDDIVARFCIAHPEVAVQQSPVRDITSTPREQLDRGECQFIVTIDEAGPGDDLAHIVLTHDAYEAVLSEDHPLARYARVSPSLLADEPFISFKVGSQGDVAIKRICRAAGFEPDIHFSADVGTTIAQFVHDGVGVSILQAKTLAKLPSARVVHLPLDPPQEFDVRMYWKTSIPLSAPAQAFLDFVRAFGSTAARGR